MKRWLTGLLATAAMTSTGLAKGKAEPAAPVSVQFVNGCDAKVDLTLGEHAQALAPKGKSEAVTLPAKDDWSYALKMGAGDLGLLSLLPGGQYVVTVSGCKAGHADVVTENLAERPKKVSPEAAAQVRFRGRQNLHVEYKPGQTGRFKPLSVAMTRYKESPKGDLPFTFRLRAARSGPVLNMRRATAPLASGHKYLIEANVVGRDVFFKCEDEGWVED